MGITATAFTLAPEAARARRAQATAAAPAMSPLMPSMESRDIAGTASVNKPVWQHQVSGATGAAVSTLFHLAAGLAGEARG